MDENTRKPNLSDSEEEQPREYTEEEVKQMRLNMAAFYEEELKFLRLQCEYEKLLSEIEIHKFKGLDARVRYFYLHQELHKPENTIESETTESKLKTE